MITDDLSAHARRIEVRFGEQMDGSEVEEAVIEFMSGVSRRCVEEGATLIGHIKSITEAAGQEGYFSCSVTNNDGRVNSNGALRDGIISLDMVLNVIIYGLEEAKIEEIIDVELKRSFYWEEIETCSESLDIEEDHVHEGHEHGEHHH